MERKLLKRNILGLLVAVPAATIALNWAILASIPNKPLKASVNSQTAGFDHSQCQYPARTSNPPDGCDNSDPCDPSNTKGGDGSCSATNSTSAESSQPSVPVVQTPLPQETPSKCSQ